MRDALHLTRDALEELPDDRRTHGVTRQHVEDALDALGDVRGGRATASDLAARLRETCAHTAVLVDMARTLA